MGWLAYLLALVSMLFVDTHSMSFNQGVGVFLSRANGINEVLFWIGLGVWAVGMLIFLLFSLRGHSIKLTGCMGCVGFVFAFLPLTQGLFWWISSILSSSWGAEGTTDPVRFWIMVIIIALFGWS